MAPVIAAVPGNFVGSFGLRDLGESTVDGTIFELLPTGPTSGSPVRSPASTDSPVDGITRWNGSSWDTAGAPNFTGPASGQPRAIVKHQGLIVVGGRLGDFLGQTSPELAVFNGTTWSAVQLPDLQGDVTVLASDGPTLYVAGDLFNSQVGDRALGAISGPTTTILGRADGDVLGLTIFNANSSPAARSAPSAASPPTTSPPGTARPGVPSAADSTTTCIKSSSKTARSTRGSSARTEATPIISSRS